jgi:putative Mn2+ efflux pump MntP
MVCDMHKGHINKWIAFSLILILGILIENVWHYREYADLKECKRTFHETCKLIAVPESVNGLLDGTK